LNDNIVDIEMIILKNDQTINVIIVRDAHNFAPEAAKKNFFQKKKERKK